MAESLNHCPVCGTAAHEGLAQVGEYEILEVCHEGYDSILCRALKAGEKTPVALRIFTRAAPVDVEMAARLTDELSELQQLPEDYFVRHLDIDQSPGGLWYRVSEWLDVESWASLLISRRFKEPRSLLKLFKKIAAILQGLHQIGRTIPHLTLRDIIIYKDSQQRTNVKIDYKLSRFLDPALDRPGPMLQHLLAQHADIVGQRPLDARSDIWSLGKVFVEILSGDPEIDNPNEAIEQLSVPEQMRTLLRMMLADDPHYRFKSMADVVEALETVPLWSRDEVAPAPSRREFMNLRHLSGWMLLLLLIGVALAVLSWVFMFGRGDDQAARLEKIANRYAPSIAFVMVDFRLQLDDKRVYQNRSEGSAFLVDNRGHLMTNRHVACPWLEDQTLMRMATAFKKQSKVPRLEYKVHLWFEGEKAFKRLPGLTITGRVEDVYDLAAAYRTDGERTVKIAGVAPPPTSTLGRFKSPLKNDFAVIQVFPAPEGKQPLPLASTAASRKPLRLAPVIALGFPLGSRTLEQKVNVSVTSGHVRRTFDTMIQVDTSIYQGNSGGPVINEQGEVVGIASSVYMEMAKAPFPVATLLSDIGIVLPIEQAGRFFEALKQGEVKWDGRIDFELEQRLSRIYAHADNGRWQAARAQAMRELTLSRDPSLVLAAGITNLLTGDFIQAEQLIGQSLSMNPDNQPALFLRYLAQWLGAGDIDPVLKENLLALDWRSPHEFLGYLTRILEMREPIRRALSGGYSSLEKAWLHYVAALLDIREGDLAKAARLLHQAARYVPAEEWLQYLILAQLEHSQKGLADPLPSEAARADHQRQTEAMLQALRSDIDARTQLEGAPQGAALEVVAEGAAQAITQLGALLEAEPDRVEVLVPMAYAYMLEQEIEDALAATRRYLAIEGRENSGKLSLGLLEGILVAALGKQPAAEALLSEFAGHVGDAWYRDIARCLLGEISAETLVLQAQNLPEYILTGHTALGLWAQVQGDVAGALVNFEAALASYLDARIEFIFARARVEKLRRELAP
jgi:S1-C subfamily serine protease